MSKADVVLFRGVSLVGQKYVLGNEPWYDIGGEPDPADELASDCSGNEISLWKKADVRFGSKKLTYAAYFGTARPTAHTIYLKGKKNALIVPYPVTFGAVFCLVRTSDGHATHTGFYLKHKGWTLESGDGTGKIGLHNLAWQAQRIAHKPGYKLVWIEFPTDVGNITPASGAPSDPGWPLMGSTYNEFGDHIRELHSMLNRLTGSKLPIGNWWGGKWFSASTGAAVKKFQKAHGLRADGFVTTTVITAMQKALVS
jgi:hypothetical protein